MNIYCKSVQLLYETISFDQNMISSFPIPSSNLLKI